MTETLDAEDAARLAWRYRRQMPRHLTPHINPDDPLSADRQRLENSDG